MTITLAILGLLAALIPWLISLWTKRQTVKDDPRTQHETRIQSIDEAIAKGAAGIDDLNRAFGSFDTKLPDSGASDATPR